MLIPKGPGAFRMTLGRALAEKCIEASHGLAELEAIGHEHLEAVRAAVPVEGHPSITQFDTRHQHRLSIVLQGLLASIYSAADIAAFLTNYVLQTAGHAEGPPPSSFNSLKKKLREGRHPDLGNALGDLEWHDRFHAMRTEWTHYSGIFVAGSVKSGISFCGGGFRRKSDQTVVEGRFSLSLEDLRMIVRGCVETLSGLAEWLLPIAVGIYDLEHVITVPEYDSSSTVAPHRSLQFQRVRGRVKSLGTTDWRAEQGLRGRSTSEPPGAGRESGPSARPLGSRASHRRAARSGRDSGGPSARA